MEIKLTKNELRAQQTRLGQLQKYLPTLQLKKAMLQLEVNDARLEIEKLEKELSNQRSHVNQHASLFSQRTSVIAEEMAAIDTVNKRWDNIAGVEVPYYEGIDFKPLSYSLFETPAYIDALVHLMRQLTEAKVKVLVVEEKKLALEKELRDVSIRVNLFEKILIPRALKNIKKIKVFLGDQELAAVSQAKVAKAKIEAAKE